MTTFDPRTVGPVPPSTAGPPGEEDARRRLAVRRLAQEFESMLMLQMVRQMRQALLEEQEAGDGLGAGTMTDTIDLEFAHYLSGTGGLGLARALAGNLAAENGVGSPAPPGGVAGVGPAGASVGPATTVEAVRLAAAAAPRPPGPDQTASGDAAPRLPLEAPVSSAYGWRSDPFVGTARFHGGIDLKAAYGREVPTAAAGRVLFAGEQGGYGQTVVVEHAGGYRTRYAHLSAMAVETGQQLADGAVVGRVGRSGRATGPHLHFEVSRDGQQIDPSELAFPTPTGFKDAGRGADFPFDRASERALSTGVDHEG